MILQVLVTTALAAKSQSYFSIVMFANGVYMTRDKPARARSVLNVLMIRGERALSQRQSLVPLNMGAKLALITVIMAY